MDEPYSSPMRKKASGSPRSREAVNQGLLEIFTARTKEAVSQLSDTIAKVLDNQEPF